MALMFSPAFDGEGDGIDTPINGVVKVFHQ